MRPTSCKFRHHLTYISPLAFTVIVCILIALIVPFGQVSSVQAIPQNGQPPKSTPPSTSTPTPTPSAKPANANRAKAKPANAKPTPPKTRKSKKTPKTTTKPPKTTTKPPKTTTKPPKTTTKPPKTTTNPPKTTTTPPNPTTNPPNPTTNPPNPTTNPSNPTTKPPNPTTNPPKPTTAQQTPSLKAPGVGQPSGSGKANTPQNRNPLKETRLSVNLPISGKTAPPQPKANKVIVKKDEENVTQLVIITLSTIGIAFVALAAGVWVFRKRALCPSEQFKSKYDPDNSVNRAALRDTNSDKIFTAGLRRMS